MNLNKKIAIMISGVFLFIGSLWAAIGTILKFHPISDMNPLLSQIVWAIVLIGGVFGTGFAIIAFFLPNNSEVKK